MSNFTDAQLLALATDVVQAAQTHQQAETALRAAKKALATALGAGGTCVIRGRRITANADASDITVETVRVVP